jgi:hypothetical protein
MTYTFATLEVSADTYGEISAKLRAAGYDHAFVDCAIDMHGIGLVCSGAGEIETLRQQPSSERERREKAEAAALQSKG